MRSPLRDARKLKVRSRLRFWVSHCFGNCSLTFCMKRLTDEIKSLRYAEFSDANMASKIRQTTCVLFFPF